VSVSLSVCHAASLCKVANTAERIEVLFGVDTFEDSQNVALDGDPNLSWQGEGKEGVFNVAFAILLWPLAVCCSTKLFARWLHGTCIEAPPQKIESEDEPFVYSYFFDISANPEILQLVFNIQNSTKSIIASLSRYLMRWKRYRSIWKVDKVRLNLHFHLHIMLQCIVLNF